MASPFISEIKLFAGNFAPRDWVFCDGRLLPISEYDALYNLIGTMYGGDGVVTFAVPDLRGRVPIHFGQGSGTSNYVQGQTGGQEFVTLTTNQMASHNHPVLCSSAGSNQALVATKATPAGNYPGTESTGAGIYETTANATMNAGLVGNSGGLGGNAQPHENRQPLLAVNFIICVVGIFPSPP